MNHFILMVMATSAISLTVTKSKIFKGMRGAVAAKAWVADATRSRWSAQFELLSELLSCHYCFSHWIAFLMVWIYGARGMTFVSWFITSMAVVGAAAVNSGIVLWLSSKEVTNG